MANTVTLDSLLDTTDGMTKLNTYVIQESSATLEIDGVSWYFYAGKSIDKIYVHSGSLGFGEDTGHLKMFYGNTRTDSLYSQEGILTTGTKFFKIRVEGLRYYSSKSYAFTYELFLFDDGNMYIHIIKKAIGTYNNLLGLCTITDGKITQTVISSSDVTTTLSSITVSNIGVNMTIAKSQYTPISETGVRVKTAPATVYIPNSLDWSALVIESYDKSGNTNVVSNFVLPDDVDVSTVGTKTVNLSYKTYTIPVEILVKEDTVAELTDIYLRDHYLLNESLTVTSIKAVWKSGKTETLKEGFEVTGFDSTTSGTKELTFSYKEATATKSVYISETAVLTVNESTKTQYYVGDTLGSISCKITYDDGTTEYVDDVETSGFDTTTAGEHIVTVITRGLSTTYTIDVSGTYSASVGSDIVGTLDLITGVLTLSGTGGTNTISQTYRGESGGLFNDGGTFSARIKSLIVESGITELNGACFDSLSNLAEVSLPEGLTTIGDYCFNCCSSLKVLTLPESLTQIGTAAFYTDTELVLTILSKNVSITENKSALNVGKIKGYLNSTAETYARTYNVPFEILDKISKIEITNYPSRDYHIGETISKSDLTVKITTGDGTEQETDLYDLDCDFSTIGEKTVTISIGEQFASFTVNVIVCKFLELINTADGMQVIRSKKNDSETDVVDGVDWFKFNNEIVNKLYISGDNWIGLGTSSSQLKICNRDGATWNVYRLETVLDNGVKVLKVRVEGYTYFRGSGEHESQIKYELFLFDNGDMYLNVIQSPASTSSYAGTSSLTCNNTTTNLSLNGASEEKPVQVSFTHQDDSGLDWDIVYKAYRFEEISKIEVITLPNKTRYNVGETFDSSGLTVVVTYDDGKTETVSDYTLSEPDMSSYGTKSVTVTYNALSTTFDIIVVEVTGIEITELPGKTKYYEDDTFYSDGMLVSQVYTDGTKETITDYSFVAPDMSTSGEKTVTVTYNDFTTTFTITVIGISAIEITKDPSKKEYYVGDDLDITDLTVTLKYTDGTSKILTNYTVSDFDSSTIGEKTVTVAYKTYTATFKVNVYSLNGIRITHAPDKIYYKIGESIDLSGMTVAIVRNDGSEADITDYETSTFDSSTAGTKTINVFCNRVIDGVNTFIGSDTFTVRVTKDGANPFAGNTDPINVTVHWINGEFSDLTNENIEQSTLTLQESICSESYFIFGGCVCNQITFQAHHEQFNGTDEEFYPSGKIEVSIECNGTNVKIFTGEIDSAERKANSLTRNFIAYDYLYKLRNTDIAWWYKNQTTDQNKMLTQKEFRNKLFEFLGIEQVETSLHWDDTYVPNTNNSNEMNVSDILKDLCLQNDRFGWMNRDGKFEYLKLRQNSYKYGDTTDNKPIYKYYNNEEVHLDTFKSFTAKEGRIWFPHTVFADPDPNRALGFTQDDYTAQEAYENNIYYNRNSFFVGNEDWMDYVWNADEYGGISRTKPIIDICYGMFINLDLRKFYRAQEYSVEVEGNPFNMVGQAVELCHTKQIQHDDQDATELKWYVHSYIMSRTLKLGITGLVDTYSANNAPFNSNSQQLGKYTSEISATVNLTRSEMPTISYEEFTDGSDSEFSTAMIDDFSDSSSSTETVKKAQLRCIKRIKKSDYDALVAAGADRTDTIYFTYEEG